MQAKDLRPDKLNVMIGYEYFYEIPKKMRLAHFGVHCVLKQDCKYSV